MGCGIALYLIKSSGLLQDSQVLRSALRVVCGCSLVRLCLELSPRSVTSENRRCGVV